jgi:hypothetical protein
MADQRQSNPSQREDSEFRSRPAAIASGSMVPAAMTPTAVTPTAPASMVRTRPMLSNTRGVIQNPTFQHSAIIALRNNDINNSADGAAKFPAQSATPFPQNPYHQTHRQQNQLVLYQQPNRQLDHLCHQFERQLQIAPFRPSNMIREDVRAHRENPTTQDIARRVAAGVSANYKGDYTLARNRPADIPEHENCSVFITGLPGNLTTNQLLSAIRDTGRIWASVINPPVSEHTARRQRKSHSSHRQQRRRSWLAQMGRASPGSWWADGRLW